jgi:hypothetical protein
MRRTDDARRQTRERARGADTVSHRSAIPAEPTRPESRKALPRLRFAVSVQRLARLHLRLPAELPGCVAADVLGPGAVPRRAENRTAGLRTLRHPRLPPLLVLRGPSRRRGQAAAPADRLVLRRDADFRAHDPRRGGRRLHSMRCSATSRRSPTACSPRSANRATARSNKAPPEAVRYAIETTRRQRRIAAFPRTPFAG